VTTLVVCVDRTDDLGRAAEVDSPVVGWEAVRSLVTDVGLADPEDSGVNSLLEALRVTRELRDDEEAEVAVVSGGGDSVVGVDRAVAEQLDRLIEEFDPDSAVVVVDNAKDERLVPIVESRVPVDAVDRVVVRQARDLESTYYLLKQFLADEELRQAVLVPIGVALLVFPAILAAQGPAVAVASLTAALGVFLLYKGFGLDAYAASLPGQARDALYAGQISLITYVVGAGLALIGVFVGALGLSSLSVAEQGYLIPAMQFTYDSVPWLAMAALAVSTGRLLDEIIREDRMRNSYLNLPFGVVGLGLVARGFSGYFLQVADLIDPIVVPAVEQGVVVVERFTLSPGQRLALFVLAGIVVSLVGVQLASYFGGASFEDAEPTE
jgi:putative membrane protein